MGAAFQVGLPTFRLNPAKDQPGRQVSIQLYKRLQLIKTNFVLELHFAYEFGWVYLLEDVLKQLFLRERVIERNQLGTRISFVMDVFGLEDASHFLQNFNHSIKTHLRFPLIFLDQD